MIGTRRWKDKCKTHRRERKEKEKLYLIVYCDYNVLSLPRELYLKRKINLKHERTK